MHCWLSRLFRFAVYEVWTQGVVANAKPQDVHVSQPAAYTRFVTRQLHMCQFRFALHNIPANGSQPLARRFGSSIHYNIKTINLFYHVSVKSSRLQYRRMRTVTTTIFISEFPNIIFSDQNSTPGQVELFAIRSAALTVFVV